MGMIGYVRQVTPFELSSFRRNPKPIKELLDKEILDGFSTDVRSAAVMMQELLNRGTYDSSEMGQLESQINDGMSQSSAQDLLLAKHPRMDQKGLDLGKSWHLLHYLLTGSAGGAPAPLGNTILGGTPIGSDLGYGPARFLTPRQVQEVAAALSGISTDELASRFDLTAIIREDIYAYGGVSQDDFDVDYEPDEYHSFVREGYLFHFRHLVEYYAEAAQSGNGMLLCIR